MSDRVAFTCNGEPVDVAVNPGESLLSVLRERLGLTAAKDGCAPQGQCGCCTVLVDGEPRVACVTAAGRVAGRAVTTVEGLDPRERDVLAAALVATGGSQCGFCTPGILVRLVAARHKGRTGRAELARALAAHLCRCTGWQTILDAAHAASEAPEAASRPRDLAAAARRATLEGGVAQRVDPAVPLGAVGFADDTAPRDALVAVPLPRGSDAESVEAAGRRWVLAESVEGARAATGGVQGRRTTREESPPLPLPPLPDGGVRLATGWVEPGYLEPDASWCEPGGLPASPLGNGGAFGGKLGSPVADAARELAGTLGRPVRVLFTREDVVRLGPKRPPMAASARYRDERIEIDGVVAAPGGSAFAAPPPLPYALELETRWEQRRLVGPPVGVTLRAVGLAEQVVLVEGALDAAGVEREALLRDERAAAVLLDVCAVTEVGACAGARVELDPATGTLARVAVRLAAGDALDDVVLRSYAIGAAHMALGWVCTEGLAVDDTTGDVLDLTIRSFGVLRSKVTPPIDVTVVEDPGAPLPRASDAVFAAVAAAAWNALARTEGARPETFPARETRAARALRR